jgi:trigger factor
MALLLSHCFLVLLVNLESVQTIPSKGYSASKVVGMALERSKSGKLDCYFDEVKAVTSFRRRMQARLVDKKAVEATIEVIIPAGEVNQTFDRMLQSIARQIKVPGFRPGKAPKNIIIQQIGEDALRQEVRDDLVEKNYPKAVKELELTAINAHLHDLKEPKENEDFSFEIHVDLYPEFKLPDYKEIVIDTPKKELTDDLIQDAISNLQREYATLIPVERAVEENDYVVLEMGGEGSRLPIDLERAGEAIRQQLLGKTMGEELELDLSKTNEEPDDMDRLEDVMVEAMDALDEAASEADEMTAELEHVHADTPTSEASEVEAAGEEGVDRDEAAEDANPLKLKVKIADVKSKEKPATDDEFAKTLGLESWAQVEERIRQNIQADLDSQTLEAQRNEFIDKLMEETNVDLPKYLIDRRKHMLVHDLEHELEHNKMTLEQYYKQLGEKGEREKFESELQESAETRVKRDLVLEQLLEQRGTTVSNAEFESALGFMANREGKNLRTFKKDMGDTWLDNYRFLLTRDKAVREVVRELVGEAVVEQSAPVEETPVTQ